MAWPRIRIRFGGSSAATLVALALLSCGSDQAGAGGSIESSRLQGGGRVEGPRFQRLSAAETGVRFRNVLRPENRLPYMYNGAGMAVGDYDGNGLPDLYLVCQDGPDRLYRQVAPLRFEDVSEQAGILADEVWGTGASFVDFDGDGDLDLYVCNLEAPNRLYRNQGNGTFAEVAGALGVAFVGATTMAAFADYDRDGDLDLYLVTNRVLGPTLPPELVRDIRVPAGTEKTLAQMAPRIELEKAGDAWRVPEAYRDFVSKVAGKLAFSGQRDRLLRNEGGVLFTDVTDQAGIRDQGMGLSATWWDYDDDGWPDLYVANDLESPDTLYHNEGHGKFVDVTARALPHTAYFGMGSDSADIDNDGRLDFVVADMSSTTHFMSKILMGDMGTRRWFLEHTRPPQYMRNALFLNTGTGRFMEVAHLAGVAKSDWTWTIRFADLDNDGWVDLFVTNGIPRFDLNPDFEIKKHRLWQEGKQREAMAVIRNIPPVPERNLAFRNDGNLHFTEVGKRWGLDLVGISHGAVPVDLDRDGDLDLVVNNLNEEVAIYRNQGRGRHSVLIRLRGRGKNRFGIGTRVTLRTAQTSQVRELTLSRGYMSGSDSVLHFGLGEADRIESLELRWPTGARQGFSDLAVDRLYTITEPVPESPVPESPARESPAPKPTLFAAAAPSEGPGFRHVERPFDDFAAQPLLPHRLSRLGPGIALGDFDGDGDEDLFAGGAAGQAGELWRNDGGLFFTKMVGPWSRDAGREDMGVLWLDVDGDGHLDLLVASGGVECGTDHRLLEDRLYLGLGAGRFEAAPDRLPRAGDSGSCVLAADFDRDGDLDLFVGGRIVPGRYPEAPRSRLWRNDGGRFTDVTAKTAPALGRVGLVCGGVWSDADGDGWPDLLLALEWGPVMLFRNEGAKLVDRTAEAGLDHTHGLWNSIAAVDLDRDGDMDYVVGNLGLNSKYAASAERPISLYIGDFDGDGKSELVEASFEDDRLFPVRGRSCSSKAMPFLAQKFPTFESFAGATLREIYSQAALQSSGRLWATQLQSVVLRNDGLGVFRIEPLPRRAQVAPVFGISVLDFDADGAPDLFLAQNSFSPEPETGRMDGGVGLLLRGLGDGRLEPVAPARSGIVVGGDAKATAVTDLDGDGSPDLLVATNDGPLQEFLNRGEGPFLRVRLRAGPGNPTAIGAHVTLVTADGRRQTREIHAGSGYLSAGGGLVWFGLATSQARELEVRWPDGTLARRRVAREEKEVLLSKGG